MKTIVFLLLIAAATAMVIHDGDILDIFNVEKIYERKELRREVFGCLMGRGHCEKYQLIKERGPSIIKSGCADCTPEQKARFQVLFKRFADEHKEEFKEMVAKFQLPIGNQ